LSFHGVLPGKKPSIAPIKPTNYADAPPRPPALQADDELPEHFIPGAFGAEVTLTWPHRTRAPGVIGEAPSYLAQLRLPE
jgi:hypothetical protein